MKSFFTKNPRNDAFSIVVILLALVPLFTDMGLLTSSSIVRFGRRHLLQCRIITFGNFSLQLQPSGLGYSHQRLTDRYIIAGFHQTGLSLMCDKNFTRRLQFMSKNNFFVHNIGGYGPGNACISHCGIPPSARHTSHPRPQTSC